jgi:hypothetical protein
MPNILEQLFADPNFAPLPDSQKLQVAHKTLMANDPEYAQASPESQQFGMQKIFSKYNVGRAQAAPKPQAPYGTLGVPGSWREGEGQPYAWQSDLIKKGIDPTTYPGYVITPDMKVLRPSEAQASARAQEYEGQPTHAAFETQPPSFGQFVRGGASAIQGLTGIPMPGAKGALTTDTPNVVSFGNQMVSGSPEGSPFPQQITHPLVAGAENIALAGGGDPEVFATGKLLPIAADVLKTQAQFQVQNKLGELADRKLTEAGHPVLGAMAGTGVALGAGLGMGAVQQKYQDLAEGRGRLKEAATEAETTAREASLAASREQEQKNIEAHQQALEKYTQVQNQFQRDHQAMTDVSAENVAKLQQQLAKEHTPAAQNAMMTEALGYQGPQRERLGVSDPLDRTAMASQTQADYASKIHNDINAPIGDAMDKWVDERDRLLGGKALLKAPVDLPIEAEPGQEHTINPLRGIVENEEANLGLNFNNTSKGLFARAKDLMRIPAAGAPPSAPPGGLTPELLKQAGGMIDGFDRLPPEQQTQLAQSMLDQGLIKAPPAGAPGAAEGEGARPPATVEEYIALQKAAKTAMRSARDGTNYNAAKSVANGVDQVIERWGAAKVPELKDLYSRYRVFRGQLFPSQLQSTIATGDVNKIGDEFFNYRGPTGENDRFNAWYRGADTGQRTTMRDLYSQWVQNRIANGDPVNRIVGPGQREVLSTLFPNSPLGSPEGYAQITSNELTMEQVLQSNPLVAQEYNRQLKDGVGELMVKDARRAVEMSYRDLRQMGPLGEQAIRAMDAAAGDPIRQSRIGAQALFGTTPQQAAQEFARQLTSPQQAGREAIGKKFGAPLETPLQRIPLKTPTTPEEAAQFALQTGRVKDPDPLTRRMINYWPVYALQSLVYTAMGHLSPFVSGMLGVGAGVNALEGRRQAFMRALEEPQTSAAYLKNLQEPFSTRMMEKGKAINAQAFKWYWMNKMASTQRPPTITQQPPIPTTPRPPAPPGPIPPQMQRFMGGPPPGGAPPGPPPGGPAPPPPPGAGGPPPPPMAAPTPTPMPGPAAPAGPAGAGPAGPPAPRMADMLPSPLREGFEGLSDEIGRLRGRPNSRGLTAAIERAQAQEVASNKAPDKVEAVMDLSRDVRKGGTPDVSSQLRTGQLSQPAIKNMLAQMNQINARGMLRFMSPSDRQHLLAMASSQDREWLQPMIG